MKYAEYSIDPKMKLEDDGSGGSKERTGYLQKFWVNHPQLGKSLIKIEEPSAPAWSEKISFEIAKQLNLPAATYEFGKLEGWESYPDDPKVTVSPDFKENEVRYFPGTELLGLFNNETHIHQPHK